MPLHACMHSFARSLAWVLPLVVTELPVLSLLLHQTWKHDKWRHVTFLTLCPRLCFFSFSPLNLGRLACASACVQPLPRKLLALGLHTSAATGLDYARDMQELVTVGEDGTINVLRLEAEKPRVSFGPYELCLFATTPLVFGGSLRHAVLGHFSPFQSMLKAVGLPQLSI